MIIEGVTEYMVDLSVHRILVEKLCARRDQPVAMHIEVNLDAKDLSKGEDFEGSSNMY